MSNNVQNHVFNRKRTNEKCGEIYCSDPTELVIHCAFCELKSNEYEVFFLHLKIMHFENNSLQQDVGKESTSELELEKSNTKSSAKSKAEDMSIKNVEENFVEREGWTDCREEKANNEYPKNEIKTAKNKGYSCEYCGKIYKTDTHLKNHVTLEHEANEESSYPVKCSECSKEFTYNHLLNKHCMDEHNGIKCLYCHRKFKRRTDLMRHTAGKHTHCNDANFECDFEDCSKRFYTQKNLVYHKRTHIRPKNFVCDVCGFSCQAGNTLRVHYRTHSDEKPHSCQICCAKFRLKHQLERHSDIHTRSNERNFVCNIENCKKGFFTGRRLEAHIRRHAMPKKYVCNVCGYSSKHNQSLQFHYRKHTAEKLECKPQTLTSKS